MPKNKKLPIAIREFKPREIDFQYQKVVSFTQLSMFQQCPHKWANQYGRKLHKSPPSINMTFGTAIHETMQNFLKVMLTESAAAADRIELDDYFTEKFRETYAKTLVENKGLHYSDPVEMREFYEDGMAILNWFKRNKGKYFNSKKDHLVGIEMPIQVEVKPGVIFVGSLDLVIYDEGADRLKIIDIKTSTRGWNDWAKKDEHKTNQIVIYKKYFSDLYGIDAEHIDVEFFIVKRKAEPTEFQEFPRRVQTFAPASGKSKMNKAQESILNFVNEVFDEQGKFIEKEYTKQPSKLCDWCPFHLTEHCKS